MKPTYLTLDTRDDRREVWTLLHRMPPRARLTYLEKCCSAVADVLGNGPTPLPSMWRMVRAAMRCDRADDRLTNSVYLDLLGLAADMRLDLVKVARDLESLARSGHPAFAAADLRAR